MLESFYKKGKKIKKENEKVANWKLGKIGNLGNLGNLGKVIPSFLFPEFLILAVGAVFDLKISKKFFRDFRDFWGFRIFGLAKKKWLTLTLIKHSLHKRKEKNLFSKCDRG